MQFYELLKRSVYVQFLIVSCSLISGVCCISAPSFIHPCSSPDPVCTTKAANEALDGYVNGIPALNISLLDPYSIPKIELKLAGLTVSFINGTLYGLRKCDIKEASINLGEKYAKAQVVCDVVLKGIYHADGNILIFVIKSGGKARIAIKQMEFVAKMYWDLVTKEDGKKYVTIKDDDIKYEIKGNMQIKLGGLFPQNPEIGTRINEFANENWMQLFDELGEPIVKHALGLVRVGLTRFFGGIPAYELLAVDQFL